MDKMLIQKKVSTRIHCATSQRCCPHGHSSLDLLCSTEIPILHAQNAHWEKTYATHERMFGIHPSIPAQATATILHNEGKTSIIELGAGQGRDTFFFAHEGFNIHALDYSATGLLAIEKTAQQQKLAQNIITHMHDIRQPLPFDDASVDACYAHMLFCMAFTGKELESIYSEVWRVLKHGGICAYTVRHTDDPHYGIGIHRGEDMYEMNGFIVHFFNREKIIHLAKGFDVIGIKDIEEGALPRKLFFVTLKKSKFLQYNQCK